MGAGRHPTCSKGPYRDSESISVEQPGRHPPTGLPYQDIPTLEYAVAFLNVSLKLDAAKGEETMRRAQSDFRIAQVKAAS